MKHIPKAGGRRGARRVSRAQLEQVHRNRQPVARTRSVGRATRSIDLEAAGRDHTSRKVFEAVSAVVDETFCEYCAFDTVRGDELVIMVDCPEFLYHARTRWHAPLMEHLKRTRGGKKIRRITFKLVERERRDKTGVRFVPAGARATAVEQWNHTRSRL